MLNTNEQNKHSGPICHLNNKKITLATHVYHPHVPTHFVDHYVCVFLLKLILDVQF